MKTLHTIYTNFAKRLAMSLMVLMTISVGTSIAQDEIVYTLTPASGSNNSYTGNCDITISGIKWNLTGNSTMQPWRIGGKSLTKVDRALYSKTAMSHDISKIEVIHGSASSITVNSFKLIISGAANSSGDTIDVAFKANATTTIELPEGNYSNKYFKFLYNVTVSGSDNKYLQFTGAKFYKKTAPLGYSVTYNNGGRGTAPSNTTASSVTLSEITATGYTNTGWKANVDVKNGSTTISAGELINNGTTVTLSQATTFTAQWTANKYIIELDNQSADISGTTSITATYNSNANLITNITIPQKNYHNFGGYYTQTNGNGTQLIDSEGKFKAGVSGYTDADKIWKYANNITLYAKWTEKSLVRYRTSCACIPPAVTIQPTSEYGWRYSIGETIGLNAIVEGASGDCTYQWQKYVVDQWQNIAGATSETFTKENCTTNDGGSYRCVVNAGNDCIAESEPYYVRVFTLDGYYYNEEIAANKIEWTGENTGVATIHLGQSRTYLFKVTDNEGKWFGYGDYAHFNYIVQPWQADCGIETGNGTNTDIRLFTGPEGDYTFTINIEHALDNEPYVNIAVAYPEVEHPVAGYGYVTKWWDNCYIHWWDNNDQALTEWGSDAQITTYTEICETEYYYFPIIDNYVNLIIKDAAGDPSNTTGNQTQTGHSGWYITHDGNSWGWHEFATYTITFDANGGNGTMDALSGICPTTDKTLTTNAFTRSGYTFAGWKANKNVTINGVSVVAGTLITDCATIQNIVSDITLTAQWTPKNITITWDANGGSVTPTSSTYTYNGATITPPTPTRANYIFNGWFTEPSGGIQIPDVGNTNKPTENVTYYAQWTEKATPTFAWSAATCTAALEADNTFPTLSNLDNLSVTYSSSDENVAKIDENGNVILGAVGETEITATGAETATHKSATTTYKLTVVESNCKWVEVTDNTTLEDGDEVVITMGKSGKTYALPNAKRTTSDDAPEAIDVTSKIVGNEMTSVTNNIKWTIEIVDDCYVFYTISNEGRYNLYCNSGDNGVCVAGSGNALTNHKFSIDGNYLKSQTQLSYLAISFSTSSWRSISDNTTPTYSGQTLKFYKRECLDSEHYWVTWDAGEGTWEDKSSKKLASYEVGAPITAPAENPTRVGYEFVGWTPAPTTMPAKNTTFTAVWTKVYKITWYENGVPSYTYVPSDNAVVTWEDNIADCGEKKFYGWTDDDTFVSDPTTPPTLISKGTTITGDVTYYAVYADAVKPANPGYTKVTTISEGTYLIATGETSSNKAYTGKYSDKTYGGTCDVTVNNQVISTKPTSAVEVEVTLGTGANSGKFAIYDGTYYLSAPSSNDLTFNSSVTYDWKLTSEGYINSTSQTSRYIQLNSSANPNRFACYTGTQKYAYLYKKQTTTYKNFAVSCATYAITVTTPTGGTVTTTPADEAGAGQTITVNVTPAECKYLTALKYNKYNDGSDYSIDISSTPYTFTMPAADVTVTATFADKTATDIEILTSAHRNLMQGSAFVGEQIKVTYDNGETETLDWDDTRLTFSGYNMATLGTYTVRVDYNDCGTANTSYSIEVIDGIAITFIDAGISETIKYELNAHVDVEAKTGQYACSGYEFVGWSETEFPLSDVPNMRTSEEYVPVRNFNATTSRTLYAVYSILKKQGWVSIEDANHIRSGAEYMIVKNRYDTYSALSTTTSTYNANYRAATILDKDEDDNSGNMIVWRRTSDNTDFQIYTGTATNDVKWLLIKKDNKNYLYNQTEKKYLQVTTTAITLTSEMADNFKITDESGDCCLNIQSATSNYYISGYNSSNNYYFQPYSTETDANYLLTRDSLFTTTPPCSPLFATFYGNGGIVTDGIKSGDYLTIQEPTRDAGITTPTASFADCNGKSWTFVGWSREEIDVTRVPVLTTDLLHDGGGNKHYNIEKNGEEFWAVFTNIGNPETKYGTITFTDADVTRQYENAKTITKSVTAMGDYDFELYHVSNASSKGIQFDHDNATRGYIKNITSLGKINSISLNDFQVGDIDYVKVYVGNMPNAINTLLTEADLQQTGNTYTYYPPKNYAYVKIEATGYCGITSISIDFGKGTQIWATTPNCSDIFLSGNELYVTSTKGQSIRAAERLTVKAVQLESKAKVVISSNSSDIYFSDVLDANFTQAVKPTETLTLTAGVDGNLAATEIYVHYRPSVDGTGMPEDVVVSANLETPNPSITDDHTIHVRNLPADFVIAAKWDGHWYALPANCTLSQSPTEGLLIEVDNIDDPKMAIAAPASAKFGLKSVYTSNSTNDRYEKNGANLVFVENVTEETPVANQTLYNGSETGIQVYAQYANYHTGNALRYEWTPTTTNLLDYTLTSAHTFTKTDGTPEEARTISLGNNGVFGTLLNDKSYNGEVRLLPATFYEPASAQVLKWKANSVIVMYTGTGTTATTQVGDNAKSAEQTLANQQLTHGIYELTTNQSLTDHAGGELNIYIGTNTRVELEIPLIISGEVTASANAHDVVILENSKLTAAETKYSYKDVYVYGGAKLAIPENTELGVNNIILRAGGVATDGAGQNATYQYIYPQVELKGTLTSAVQNIRYEYVTDNDHWYHLVLPFDGSLASIHYPYEYYGDQVKLDNKGSWIIKRYNGATRAIGNYDAWVDIETEGKTSTTAGQGYIFWGAPKKVTANGAYERPKWGIQRITMLSKVSETINEATKAEKNDKTVSGLSSHKDVPNNSGKVNDQGWNLIGNPYMVNLTGLNSESLKPGKLVEVEDAAGNWTGQWKDNEDGFRYVTIPSDHFDTYTAQRMTAFTEANPMIAGRAFFIQLEDDDAGVTFSAANRASLLAARVAANEPTTDIETGIVLSNETMQDEVNFWIKDGKTNDYEYNADYPKTPNNTNFNIYGVHAHGDLSWVATGPEFAKESMPIGYQVPAAGTYMLSVSEEYYSDEIDALYVTDHEMSPEVTTDLMIAPYEFSVNQAETNNMRFTVSIKLKKDSENDATGLDNININGEEIQKFIYQDKMYILHHGIIYDATGKRVITINK